MRKMQSMSGYWQQLKKVFQFLNLIQLKTIPDSSNCAFLVRCIGS